MDIGESFQKTTQPPVEVVWQYVESARCGDLEGVTAFLKKYGNVYVDTKLPLGTTALQAAVKNGQLKIIKELHAAHADVNARARDGSNMLACAIDTEQSSSARLLIAFGAMPDKVQHGDPLINRAITALQFANDPSKKFLPLSKGEAKEFLIKICQEHRLDYIEEFIEVYGAAQINAYGDSLLSNAMQDSTAQVVKALLEQGAVITGDILFGAIQALASEKKEVKEKLRLVLDRYTGSFNIKGNNEMTVLTALIEQKEADIDMIGSVLDRGADININNENVILSPLVFAISFNRKEVVRLLLDRGADFARDSNYILAFAHARASAEIEQMIRDEPARRQRVIEEKALQRKTALRGAVELRKDTRTRKLRFKPGVLPGKK